MKTPQEIADTIDLQEVGRACGREWVYEIDKDAVRMEIAFAIAAARMEGAKTMQEKMDWMRAELLIRAQLWLDEGGGNAECGSWLYDFLRRGGGE